ncbi:MAG TPA: amidohydrolase family protein [Flavisolibacter sp.]|jgi:cytosine/adenosine deaminase-related metal-dependent hydrolase|nr:amidohydrolase family protein [Flavisolibacter sp.]
MNFRKLGAERIFNGRKFLEDTVLMMREDHSVEALVPLSDAGDHVEFIKGVLSPGFINCHCHLELSHLQSEIEPHGGLVPFIMQVMAKRQVAEEIKTAAMSAALQEMWVNGISAVGDICNTGDSIELKQGSGMQWQNFIEVISLLDATSSDRVQQFDAIREKFRQNGLSAGLVPHAPYSISPETFRTLNRVTAGKTISIHNQETAAEDELFKSGTGAFLQLYAGMGHPGSPLPASGRSSLQTWLPFFTNGQTILTVHNTFIAEEDIVFAKEHAQRYGLELVYCLCPNANLYIEGTLPPVELLVKHGCCIVLGTDSYGSNRQLDICSEISPILKAHPTLTLETVLEWATASGAEALGWSELGHFKKGAKPGVVAIGEGLKAQRLI